LIPFRGELRQASTVGQAAGAIVEEIAAGLVAIADKTIGRVEVRRLRHARALYANRTTASRELCEGKAYARPKASRFVLWVDFEVQAVHGKRRSRAFVFRGRAYRKYCRARHRWNTRVGKAPVYFGHIWNYPCSVTEAVFRFGLNDRPTRGNFVGTVARLVQKTPCKGRWARWRVNANRASVIVGLVTARACIASGDFGIRELNRPARHFIVVPNSIKAKDA
jgi:hypothetical protein